MWIRQRYIWSLVSGTALVFVLSHRAASAQEAPPAGRGVDGEAMNSIQRMTDFLAAAKQFRVTIDIGYDVVQDWGQKIEFGETRVLTVRRPERLRVETTDRDGSQSGVVFDGTTIAAFDLGDKVYATTPKSGSIDDAISHLVDDLGMRLPMAPILRGRMPQSIKEWARDVRSVGQQTIGGVPCDHVAVHGDWEDVQLWIARGDRPLLQRIVITYTRAEGKPQFWARFENWNLSPDVSDAVFAFTPPEGAAKIDFVPRRTAPGPPAADATAAQP